MPHIYMQIKALASENQRLNGKLENALGENWSGMFLDCYYSPFDSYYGIRPFIRFSRKMEQSYL